MQKLRLNHIGRAIFKYRQAKETRCIRNTKQYFKTCIIRAVQETGLAILCYHYKTSCSFYDDNMMDAAVLKLDLYKPRTLRKNMYYRLVEAHHEKLEGVWEERYQSKYGFWRPYVKNVIYRYLDCGYPHFGFARVRCGKCGYEYLLDIKRFIKRTSVTVIDKEEKYDGYYALATNLDDDTKDILKINSQHYKIEDCFPILKTNFSAGPVYQSKKNRIISHFMVYYTALLIYRLLEYKLDQYGTHFTTDNILDTLKNMNVLNSQDMYYTEEYTTHLMKIKENICVFNTKL
jgi:hypothetical protein